MQREMQKQAGIIDTMVTAYQQASTETSATLFDIVMSLPCRPRDWQLEELVRILNDLKDIETNGVSRNVICGAYGIGKTTFLAIFALVHLYTFGYKLPLESYKGSIVSGSQTQLYTILHAEITRLLSNSCFNQIITITKSKMYLNADESKFIRFCVWNESNQDSFAGVHADNVLTMFDEGTAICEEAYKIANTYNTSGRCCWIVTGNPTTTGGEFFKLTTKPTWEKRHVSRYDFFGPDDEFASDIKLEYGEESDIYRTQVLGQFALNSSNAMFTAYTLNECAKRGYHIKTSGLASHTCGPVCIGVDVARGEGVCDHAITVRDFYAVRKIVTSQCDLIVLHELVVSIALQYDVKIIAVDTIGCGAGVDQAISIELNRALHRQVKKERPQIVKVVPIISNERPHYNMSCQNRRAELAMEARKWCESFGGFVPGEHVRRLVDELSTLVLDQNVDKVCLEKKTGPKDVADSFLYTFADPLILRPPTNNILNFLNT